MANPNQQLSRNPALDEILEARDLLERAAKTVARALATPQRLAVIGEAIAARDLLTEAKERIEHAAEWARPS